MAGRSMTETEVVYARLEPSRPCVCGNPEGKPVQVQGQTLIYFCANCWSHKLAEIERARALHEAKQ